MPVFQPYSIFRRRSESSIEYFKIIKISPSPKKKQLILPLQSTGHVKRTVPPLKSITVVTMKNISIFAHSWLHPAVIMSRTRGTYIAQGSSHKDLSYKKEKTKKI